VADWLQVPPADRALALGDGVVEPERGGDDGSRDLRNELAQLEQFFMRHLVR